jgi:hypothetical protein
MSDAFVVRPLKCGHCGAELPIMGQLVTFQCQTCFKHWVLSADGLRPVVLYQARPVKEFEGTPVFLPFWMIEVDTSRIREQVTTAVEEIQVKTRTIAGARLEPEKESEFQTLLRENFGGVQKVEISHLVATATKAVSAPNSAEVNNLLRRLESIGTYYVYVPAFQSPNTYAYLKIGRLMTKRQPSFTITKPGDVSRSVLCALQADEAVALIDFVFFATLPESIQESGNLLERIQLSPSRSPFLVEFPFIRHRSSFESLVVDFHISSKLVER